MTIFAASPFDTASDAPATMVETFLSEVAGRSEDDLIDAHAAVGIARRLASDATTIDLLTRLGERLEALARIQRILRLSRQSEHDLGASLCELCSQMVEARFAPRGIFIHVRAASITLDARRAWIALIIVSELLLNAHRRGFRAAPGVISVEAREDADSAVLLFRDDGSARRFLEDEDERHDRPMLRAIAGDAGGSIAYPECPLGLSVELRFPVARPAAEPRLFARVRSAFSARQAA